MVDWSSDRSTRGMLGTFRHRWVAGAICLSMATTALLLWWMIDAHEASQTHVDELALAFGLLVSVASAFVVATLQQTQRELHMSEKRFRSFFEKAAFGITTVRSDGTVIEANPAMATLLGYSIEELQRMSVVELTYTDDRQAMHGELLGLAASDSMTSTFETRLIHKDGHVVWVNFGTSWVPDEDEFAKYATSIVRDITNLKDAEEKLRLADQILQRIHAVVVAADRQGQITYVSPYVESLLGYAPKQLLGEGWWQRIVQSSGTDGTNGVDEIRGYVARCARREDQPTKGAYENQVFDVNGHPHWIVWTDANGPGNVLIGVGHDVTDLKAAQGDANRLAEIVETTDDGIVSMSLDGTVLSWNPGAEKLYGYSAAEMVGQSEQLLVPPDNLAEFHRVLACIERGESLYHYETERMGKDGQLKPVSLTVSPLRNRAGTVVGCSKIARDLTDLKKTNGWKNRPGSRNG